jgi:hypothetical protein
MSKLICKERKLHRCKCGADDCEHAKLHEVEDLSDGPCNEFTCCPLLGRKVKCVTPYERKKNEAQDTSKE